MFNFDRGDWTSLISSIFILSMLISSIFIRGQGENSKKLKQFGIWLLIIFLGVIFYNNKNLFKNFIPYHASETENNKLELRKTNDNHFYIKLSIENTNILFLIDTGATTTSLTIKDARRLGIDLDKLKFNQPVNTANGTTFSASAEIKNIQIGNKTIKSMWVLVNKDLTGNSLLGMNFLNRLEGYEVKKDTMILYY